MIPLNILKAKSPAAVIMRHAERDPIENVLYAFEAMLTDKGRDEARELGQKLDPISPVTFYHSPVERCRETALYMIEGIQSYAGEVDLCEMEQRLGGLYVRGPWEEVSAQVNDMGHDKFLRHWYNGGVSDDLLMPLDEAAQMQVDMLVEQLKRNTPLTINVTHDWNIMLVREYFFKLNHETIGQPPFMDAVTAYNDTHGLHLHYRGTDILL